MIMPPTLICPACGHDRQVHFAEQDRPEWGCYVDECECGAGYEVVGDLIAGRLRDEGNAQLDALQDEVDRRQRLGQAVDIPMSHPADIHNLPQATLGDLELADALTLGTLAMDTALGRLPALLFRFSVSGPRPHRYRDRAYVLPNADQVDRMERLFGDAFALARKVLEG